MSCLDRIHRGKEAKAPILFTHGPPGGGKSSFANGPKSVFLQTEDGLNQIDCAKFPLARTFDEVMAYLTDLLNEPHDFEIVVVDTLDWLERLIWDFLCRQHGVSSIERVDGGFGRGYMHALTHWRQVLALLERLRDQRGMIVHCIAHSKIERFEDPEAPAYDRYVPRLNKHACDLVCEWADAVFFATRKFRVQQEEVGFNRKRGMAYALGKDGGERVLRTVGGPACLAKNRFALPEEIPLSWDALMAALTHTHKDVHNG